MEQKHGYLEIFNVLNHAGELVTTSTLMHQ